MFAPFFPPMFLRRVFPAVAPKSPAKGRPDIKFRLVLEILADIKPAPGLQPSEIKEKRCCPNSGVDQSSGQVTKPSSDPMAEPSRRCRGGRIPGLPAISQPGK